MSRNSHADARRAVWMIFGLLAIPVFSVTSAALLVDIACTTDPAAAVAGIPAVFGGVITGALCFRLARSVHSGVADAWAMLLASVAAGLAAVTSGPRLRPSLGAPRPALAFVPAGIGRRGPPVVSR